MAAGLESEDRVKQVGAAKVMDLTGIILELRGMADRVAAIILILERPQPATTEPEPSTHSFGAIQNQLAQTSAAPAPGIRGRRRCRRCANE
jgi:hypothetical protein